MVYKTAFYLRLLERAHLSPQKHECEEFPTMYPEEIVEPFRKELTANGFRELRTEQDVNDHFRQVGEEEKTLIVVNSVCGCAAGIARPGVLAALSSEGIKPPNHLLTVFAGQDKAATEKVRSLIVDYPPSSPSIALFHGTSCSKMIHRSDIEGNSLDGVAGLVRTLLLDD